MHAIVRVMPAALVLLLAGCETMSSMNPVNWWHQAEGGKIAQDRPPPPGENDPYPNLASVPAKPTPPDVDAMKKLTAGLVADREHAQYTAASAPLPDPSSPNASPGLFGAGTLPPPAPPPGAASATLPAAPPSPAASAPSPSPAMPEQPAAPPSPAPRKPVQSTPLAAPEMPAPADAPPPKPVTDSAPPAAMPPLPTTPPPRPADAAVPPPPNTVATLTPAPAGADATSLMFEPGSASVTSATTDTVKQLAAKRGGATIAVTGYGDATSSDPTAQSAALSLALSRAQAVANALQANGVPIGAIRVGGEAAGRGVSVRLLQ